MFAIARGLWPKPRRTAALALGCTLTLATSASCWAAPAPGARTPGASAPVNVIWHPDPPYALNKNGVPSGFEIDLWRMIAETHGIPYRIRRARSFSDLLNAVSSGTADLAIGGILINENRSKKFQFSFPTATSELKIYETSREESAALRLLQVLASKETLLIFLGVALIACFFALPVWLLERNRSDLSNKRKRHQLVLILQKTLLLSTDHTQKSTTRIISIGSLFARVLLTAYFTSYILKTASNTQRDLKLEQTQNLETAALQNKVFASIRGSIQESILNSSNIKQIDCNLMTKCIRLVDEGKADAILADNQSMKSGLLAQPTNQQITASSETLTTLFIAFGFSKQFLNDPRARIINDAIARSYYDGTHSSLSRSWLNN